MGIYLACKGLKASLTKEGYEEDQRRGKIGKRVYKKLFGRLAPIMPYSTAIIFLLTLSLAALLIRMLWKRYMILPLWIFVFMMMIPVGYAVWFSRIIRKLRFDSVCRNLLLGLSCEINYTLHVSRPREHIHGYYLTRSIASVK